MKSLKELWILRDYRGAFYSTIKNRWGLCSFDISVLIAEFEKREWTAKLAAYKDIDFRRMDFADQIVLYQSTEDPGLRYKSYQEDILLGILLQGGILIPKFRYFRAHHNKVFWEILRSLLESSALKSPSARGFGTLEEFLAAEILPPIVLKASEGAGSQGVYLANSQKEARRHAASISKSDSSAAIIREIIKRLIRRRSGYVDSSWHRNKFVAQEFIRGLEGDFKVLTYWDKYYVLRRDNRPHDFRASGSGRFYWPKEPPSEVLDFARRLFSLFSVPIMSADIALSAEGASLLEAQFVTFGPLTMERSNWHFEFHDGQWRRIDGCSIPEAEFARSVVEYLINTKLECSI